MMKMKNLLLGGMSLALVACISVGGTLAYLSSQTGTVTNKFTMNGLTLVVSETADAATSNGDYKQKLFAGNSGETEVYYYKYPVPAGQSTSELLETIGIPADLTNEYADKTVKLEAVADGVQFAGADAADLNASGILASWGVVAQLDVNGNLVSVTE